jgi:hypothetical protein
MGRRIINPGKERLPDQGPSIIGPQRSRLSPSIKRLFALRVVGCESSPAKKSWLISWGQSATDQRLKRVPVSRHSTLLLSKSGTVSFFFINSFGWKQVRFSVTRKRAESPANRLKSCGLKFGVPFHDDIAPTIEKDHPMKTTRFRQAAHFWSRRVDFFNFPLPG